MERRGIQLGKNGDLEIKVARDSGGLISSGLVVGESDFDYISTIIESDKGDFKDYPVLGIGKQYIKSVGRAAEMRADVQTQLELDGYKADVQVDDTGKLTIDV